MIIHTVLCSVKGMCLFKQIIQIKIYDLKVLLNSLLNKIWIQSYVC